MCLWGPLSISRTPQPFSLQPRPSGYGIERFFQRLESGLIMTRTHWAWAKVRHFVTFFFLFLLPSTGSSASASPLYNSPPSLQIQSLSKGIVQVSKGIKSMAGSHMGQIPIVQISSFPAAYSKLSNFIKYQKCGKPP